MKIVLTFICLICFASSSLAEQVECEIIDNKQNRNVLGILETNLDSMLTKIKANSSIQVINDNSTVCGVDVSVANVEETLVTTKISNDDPLIVLLNKYSTRFTNPANNFPYTYEFNFIYSENGNLGSFKCKERGDEFGSNHPASKFNYSVQNCGVVSETVSCFGSIQELSSSISDNMSCVKEKAATEFDSLCSSDGLTKTSLFERYLSRKEKYEAMLKKVDEYLADNPGASQIPQSLAGRLQNAENAWLTAGKRNEVDNLIETIRRNSVDCD